MADKPTVEQIREALSRFDPENGDQWTNEGLPALDVLKEMLGVKVTRSEVTGAAPTFNREHPSFDEPAASSSEGEENSEKEPTDEQEFEAVKAQLDEIDTQMESLRKRRLELQAEHDRLNTLLSGPKMSEADNIAQYLERSQQERAARAMGRK